MNSYCFKSLIWSVWLHSKSRLKNPHRANQGFQLYACCNLLYVFFFFIEDLLNVFDQRVRNQSGCPYNNWHYFELVSRVDPEKLVWLSEVRRWQLPSSPGSSCWRLMERRCLQLRTSSYVCPTQRYLVYCFSPWVLSWCECPTKVRCYHVSIQAVG